MALIGTRRSSLRQQGRNEGSDDMCRIIMSLTIIMAALAYLTTPSILAQDAASSYTVQIRSGSCEAPGEGLAQLEDVTYSGLEMVGSAEAAPAASSYSVAPVSLAALTSSSTAFVVLDGNSAVMVACGEIGGVIGSDGALSIGLRPVEESGISGIAYLAPDAANPTQTGISTFLAITGFTTGEDAVPAETAMEANAYSSMVSSQLTILVGSLQRIDALFDQAAPGESSWSSQVGGELFLWKLLFRVAQDVNPPTDFADFNQDYLEALGLMDSAASDILQALQTSDEAKLASAGTKIQEAVTILRGLQSSQSVATPTAGTPVP